MSSQPDDPGSDGRGDDELVSATRRSVSERLADPYLTDHDRWVLRQFGRFLSGITPEPRTRTLRITDPRPLERHPADAGQP
mgnify:FL=1